MVNTHITPSGFKSKSDLHMARKVWHMSGVFTLFACWQSFPYWLSMILLGLAWVSFVPADFLRQRNAKLNKFVSTAFKPIMRGSEYNRLAGTTYLITGVLLIAALFTKEVVSLSLLFLAFADPIASYVGIKYGTVKIFGHKSLQGFLAALVVCFLATLAFLFYNDVKENLFIISLLAGFVGAMAELVPLAKIDDNFTMPLMSSLGLASLFYFFNIFHYFN
jgi:diacylglycerol kinase (CTP)